MSEETETGKFGFMISPRQGKEQQTQDPGVVSVVGIMMRMRWVALPVAWITRFLPVGFWCWRC